ncbi:GFA family protein [Tianweitania sp.]|uniref:GFA family protein n=1 Tax=Tianweitania sp. TaxID=2021634 RepID=UPI0028997FF9|nr:GFA family protein [Tianweitania sp.]
MAKQVFGGGCQCGAVRYETTADLDQAISCNCSRCGRLGLILSFSPVEEFQLQSGEDALGEYQFNQHRIRHRFCKTCGVQSFAIGTGPDGREMAAINVRCLDGIDVHTLHPKQVDGRSF